MNVMNVMQSFLCRQNCWSWSRLLSNMSASGPAAASSELIIDVQDRVASLTLNRPKAMNALNLAMIRAFYPRYSRSWYLDSR